MEITKHHRRPRFRGGDERPWNISFVYVKQHEAWHTIFNHLEPEEICKIINEYYLNCYCRFICRRKKDGALNQNHDHGCRHPSPTQKQRDAWITLFNGMDSETIRKIINAVWLDYRYEFIPGQRRGGLTFRTFSQISQEHNCVPVG